jgi:DNA-directed RNA polymerase subunit RPC12/RpoP
MGSILRMDCVECDYETELYLGEGMMGIEYEAYGCPTCREIVAVACTPPSRSRVSDIAANGARCPGCGGKEFVHVHWLGDAQDRLVECPRCGGWAPVEPWGIWD